MIFSKKARSYINPVKNKTPWYMLALDEQKRIVDKAPRDIQDHLSDFVENGVVIIKDSVSLKQCSDAISEFESIIRINQKKLEGLADEDGYFHRIVNMHQASDRILEVFTENKALKVVEFLFDIVKARVIDLIKIKIILIQQDQLKNYREHIDKARELLKTVTNLLSFINNLK